MPLQDRIAHAAAVTKWKANQQMRLLKSQGRVGEVENQIKVQKALLADMALTLFSKEQLIEDELKQICDNIAMLNEQIMEQKNLQEAIKAENAPELQAYSADIPPQQGQISSEDTSGLVCPECNRPLIGQFCPDHGVEGVPPSMVDIDEQTENSTGLICPVCKRPLKVRFCPEHGVEGVPT